MLSRFLGGQRASALERNVANAMGRARHPVSNALVQGLTFFGSVAGAGGLAAAAGVLLLARGEPLGASQVALGALGGITAERSARCLGGRVARVPWRAVAGRRRQRARPRHGVGMRLRNVARLASCVLRRAMKSARGASSGSALGRFGRLAQGLQELADVVRLADEREDAHPSLAPRALERIDAEGGQPRSPRPLAAPLTLRLRLARVLGLRDLCRSWLTDTLAGAGLGTAVGILVPLLFHAPETRSRVSVRAGRTLDVSITF